MNDEHAHDLLEFQVKKDMSYLYKRLLNIMEGVREDHFFMLEKLYASLPKEYHPILKAANHFDENKFAYIRKNILDGGNDAIRNVGAQLKKFDVEFTPKSAQSVEEEY